MNFLGLSLNIARKVQTAGASVSYRINTPRLHPMPCSQTNGEDLKRNPRSVFLRSSSKALAAMQI